MSPKRRPVLAGLTMVLVAVLAACGGGSNGTGTDKGGTSHGGGAGSGYTKPVDPKVKGVRDDVRHQLRRTVLAKRPHYVKKCDTETRKVRHSKRSNGRTRTWYTTKKVRDCERVRKGTESYRRVVRPERWCVRLDDVGGRKNRDDVWYRVQPADYSRVNSAADRAKVSIEPISKGC
jgi:hypothetical protein